MYVQKYIQDGTVAVVLNDSSGCFCSSNRSLLSPSKVNVHGMHFSTEDSLQGIQPQHTASRPLSAYCKAGVFNWFCPRDHHSDQKVIRGPLMCQ